MNILRQSAGRRGDILALIRLEMALKARGHGASVIRMGRNEPFDGSPNAAPEGSKNVARPFRTLALPFVGLALGALPGVAYAALVALVHLVVFGRWDRVPAFAAGCVIVTAAVGFVGGAWLAISRVCRAGAGEQRHEHLTARPAALTLSGGDRFSAN